MDDAQTTPTHTISAFDAGNVAHELRFEPASNSLVSLVLDEDEYLIEPWEAEFGISLAAGRLPRPPWPSQAPESPETSPFDVVCLAQRRAEAVSIDTRASVERMSQQQRANRALEVASAAFDLMITVRVPNVGGATAQVLGVPGSEVTVTALYWTAHVLRSMSEDAARSMGAAKAQGNGRSPRG